VSEDDEAEFGREAHGCVLSVGVRWFLMSLAQVLTRFLVPSLAWTLAWALAPALGQESLEEQQALKDSPDNHDREQRQE
jgi:hypothetical protein